MAHRREKRAEAKLVTDWNARYHVGQAVAVQRDNGSTTYTKTRSQAELLSGHTAVVWLEGISGCYDLRRVFAATAEGK